MSSLARALLLELALELVRVLLRKDKHMEPQLELLVGMRMAQEFPGRQLRGCLLRLLAMLKAMRLGLPSSSL